MRVIAVEPELSTAFHSAVAAGEPVPVTPASIADGLNAPFAGRIATEICQDLERVLVTEDGDRARVPLPLRARQARLRTRRRGRHRSVARGQDRRANPVILVSGGNVAGQTAAAILARP